VEAGEGFLEFDMLALVFEASSWGVWKGEEVAGG
jgi:hypothetical protein